MKKSAQQASNETIVISAADWDSFGQLLDVVCSQGELISQLSAEQNERFRRDASATQRRAKVFRIPTRS